MAEEKDNDQIDEEIRKKKINKSINILADLQGLQRIINLADENEADEEGDWLDDQILQLKPEKLMCDIIDRLEALNVVMWVIKETREKSASEDDDEDDNNESDNEEVEEVNGNAGEAKEQDEAFELDAIKNKVFIAAVSMTVSKLGKGWWEKKSPSGSMGSVTSSVLALLNACPDESKMTDGRGALLTHWAMLAAARPEYDVSEADVKALVKQDPMSMRKHHMTGLAAFQPGGTPAHFLCMQQETDSVMALIRHYATYNPTAFTRCASYPRDQSDENDCQSALHAACTSRCPSKEFLQLMISIDPSQAMKKASRYSLPPLAQLCHGALCFRQEGTKYSDAVQCLLNVNSSAEYIGQALCGLLYGACKSQGWTIEEEVASMQQHVLEMMDMLLAINPDAAKYRTAGWNLLHHMSAVLSTMPSELCIIMMQRILALNADAVRDRGDISGVLPVHIAADNWPMEVMKFLLNLYPESASLSFGQGHPNMLSCLLQRKNRDPIVVVVELEAKVRLLCSRYPQLPLQKDDWGNSALYWALRFDDVCTPVVKILCETGGRELVSTAKTSPLLEAQGDNDDELDNGRGWLPLHVFIFVNCDKLSSYLPFSDEAECLRLLLHLYPEAVGIEAGVGIAYRKTPYQLAVANNVDPSYLRMMLRAVPHLNPGDLRRLNYAERRMAMFLAFTAVSTDEHVLLPRLRFENKDLLKRVVSFL